MEPARGHSLQALDRTDGLTAPAQVEEAISRIEGLNPQLNAVITPLFEKARVLAASPDLPEGPFKGVPFLLKDLGLHLEFPHILLKEI